jgi:MFS transporter, FHS family, L-fucose permease
MAPVDKLVQTHDSSASISAASGSKFTAAFMLVTSLFFMWAMAHNLNDILIKKFETTLDLTRGEASFIQVTFYIAYFAFALPAGYAMKRIGLKRTMMLGLGLYGAGAIGFYPAAEMGTFGTFLIALFVIASGIVCLEIAAGAFIVLAGTSERAAFRINLAQAFNGLGAVVAPIIGGAFILAGHQAATRPGIAPSPARAAAERAIELHQVQLPYLLIALIAAALLLLMGITRFPPEGHSQKTKPVSYTSLFQQRVFTAAAVAQFLYVGAQVAVWSYFIDFVKDARPGTSDSSAAYLLSASLFLFMFGRFTGSLVLRRVSAPVALAACGALASITLLGAVMSAGNVSVACLMAISLFMSIMYPTIFALGVTAAREQGEIGASVLVMTIVGGAAVPPALGFAADHFGLRPAYLIVLVCFLAVMWFGWFAKATEESLVPTPRRC